MDSNQKEGKQKVESFEMWCQQKMQGVRWKEEGWNLQAVKDTVLTQHARSKLDEKGVKWTRC